MVRHATDVEELHDEELEKAPAERKGAVKERQEN